MPSTLPWPSPERAMYGPSFAAPFVPSQGYAPRRALQSGAAASGSRGALQPATEDGGAPGAAPPSFTIASFNFGFEQNVMMGKKSRKHFDNFQRLCAKIVVDADADFLFGCEVGASRQGLSRAAINVADILREPFGDDVGFTVQHNYVSMWGFGGASQPVDVSLHGAAAIYWLPLGRDVHAAIVRFDVQINGYGTVHVITGNMHIVCGESPPSVPARQQMVDHLRQHLNSYRPPSSYTRRSRRSRTREAPYSFLPPLSPFISVRGTRPFMTSSAGLGGPLRPRGRIGGGGSSSFPKQLDPRRQY